MSSVPNPWFEDDRLWDAISPMLMSDDARAKAVNEVQAIAAMTRRPPGAVLDLGCGAGRHSVAFAAAGHRVTGVDRSALLLGHARAYAATKGADVRWIHQDMRDFVEPGAFDLAVCLFTSFGYFEDAADNERVLANAHASLRPGSPFVLDVMGKEVLARIFQPVRAQDLPDGRILVYRSRAVDAWSRIENHWSLIGDGDVVTFRFTHWVYSAVELTGMLQRAGFARITAFGNLDGAPYGHEAERLVLCAWKA